MKFNDATLAQIYAANPIKNTWVSANAGSGKTRVLTDRVARLLLNNTDPQKILCLTYTKAAAAEMQNRLFDSLGKWAMLPDEELRTELKSLGENENTLSPDKIKQARTLFAAALETPGGLKIQTIHSFCDALLRRFPLEAGVSPQFNMLEERQAKQLRIEVVERMAQQSETSEIDMLAKHLTRLNTDDLTNEIVKKRTGFDIAPTPKDFGISQDISLDKIFNERINPHNDIINSLIELLKTGSKNDIKAADKLREYFLDNTNNTKLKILEKVFLNGKTAKAGPYSAKENVATLKLILQRKLQTLLDVGLSYIKLGQSATTLSGGEAQRIKLALELSKRDTGRTIYILDEPTTGLHFADIELLLKVLTQLRDAGNTIVALRP